MRRHGFQWPLEPLQVLSWALFAAGAALTATVVVPILPGGWAWAFCGGYALLALGTAALAGHTTASNAVDPCVLRGLDIATRGDGAPAGAESGPRCAALCGGATVAPLPPPLTQDGADPAGESMTYCYMCQVAVARRSKHCKLCRKCVLGFDHHCAWLNNCIGACNYAAFAATLASALLLLSAQAAGAAAALQSVLAEEAGGGWPAAAARREGRLGDGLPLGRTAHTALLALLLLLSAPPWLLLCQLCAFHASLRRQGLSTYDYILREQLRANEPPPPPLPRRAAAWLRARCAPPPARPAAGRAAAHAGSADAGGEAEGGEAASLQLSVARSASTSAACACASSAQSAAPAAASNAGGSGDASPNAGGSGDASQRRSGGEGLSRAPGPGPSLRMACEAA